MEENGKDEQVEEENYVDYNSEGDDDDQYRDNDFEDDNHGAGGEDDISKVRQVRMSS